LVALQTSPNISVASSFLEGIFPDATTGEIQEALSASGGDANEAAHTLLGNLSNIYQYNKNKP